jgi:site-specific recombinase XerD
LEHCSVPGSVPGTGTVAELLGHASLDSTRIYTLPTDEGLDAAIARLTVDR